MPELICPSCGKPNPAGFVFCGHCASPLQPTVAAPWFPTEERKVVTVLFADLADSTVLSARLDPETVREMLSRFFAAMREEIRKFAGSVEKFIGDAVMAVFGLPHAHGDDPVRAIEAALGMRSRLERLNEDLKREYGATVQMRIGIDTGEVMAAAGPAEGRDFLVTGDAVNVAARLEKAARPHQILVGERAYRFSRGHFLFRSVGPLTLKGKDTPVQAWEVVGPAAVSRVAHPGARLLGRETEVQKLQEQYANCVEDRNPRLISVIGDVGIGKSRLVQEFLNMLPGGERQPEVRSARWHPYGETSTYGPLSEILKIECGILDTDSPVRARDKLMAGLEQIGVAEYAEAIGYSVGLEFPASAIGRMEPKQVGFELARSWMAFFERKSRRQPLVTVFEDLHWAADAILDLIEFIIEGASDAPLLFLGLARPELVERRPGMNLPGERRSVIRLDRLRETEGEQLLDSIVQPYRLSDPLRRQILDNAEGNPFFIEEMARMLLDTGPAEPGAVLESTKEQIGGLPDTVQGAIAARIDQLPPLPRAVLQRAAVIGRVFWIGPMRSYVDVDQLDQAIDELKRKEFIRDRSPSVLEGEREYSFKHVLIQEVAVATLPKSTRGQIHQQVAGWLEHQAGPRIVEVVEPLAYHYREAARLTGNRENRAKAVKFLHLAAEHAYRRYALREAAAFAQTGMEFGSADEQSVLEEFLGDIRFLQGRLAEAERHYRGALEGSSGARDQARLHRKIVPTRRLDQATEEELERARTLLTTEPDAAEEAAILIWQGRIAHHRMEYDRALQYFQQAQAVLKQLEDRQELARCIYYSGLTLIHRGRYGDALTKAGELKSIADSLHHPYFEAMAYRLLAEAHLHRGGHMEALQAADLILVAGAAIGTEATVGGLRMKGRVLGRLGRLHEAAEALRQALTLADHIEYSEMGKAMIVENLSIVLGDLGDGQAAQVQLAMGHRMAKAAGYPELKLRMALGGLRLATIAGRPRPNLTRCERLLAQWPNSRALTVQILAAIGEGWVQVGEPSRAARAAAACREIADNDGAVFEGLEARRVQGRAAMLRSRWDEAVRYLRDAADGFLRIASRLEWARSLVLLAEVTARIGNGENGRMLFDQAHTVLKECGAAVDLERLDAVEHRFGHPSGAGS